jgi:hypothetical protein
MEKQLKTWGASLDQLVVKAEVASADLKEGHKKRVAELRAKHDEAQKKFDEFKAAGADKWEGFKNDVERAWKDVETTFKDLKN